MAGKMNAQADKVNLVYTMLVENDLEFMFSFNEELVCLLHLDVGDGILAHDVECCDKLAKVLPDIVGKNTMKESRA